MKERLLNLIQEFDSDSVSGASDLTLKAIDILEDVLRTDPGAVEAVAVSLCTGQPAMASVWNAAAVALRPDAAASISRFRRVVGRAPDALARVSEEVLLLGCVSKDRFSVLTISSSGAVKSCLLRLAKSCRLSVICAESRPNYEGRKFAMSLADQGIATSICTDAAAASLCRSVDVFLCGADAVFFESFINKCGTGQLINAASECGIPPYVIASRDKFSNDLLESTLTLNGGPADEVWPKAPNKIGILNPYFERVPTKNLAGIITDFGNIPPVGLKNVSDGLVVRQDIEKLIDTVKNMSARE
mgnify:CR=1 FL=1|tara:strand:+ start:2043 stop:2948 length:906 start_codon:yes stop_codon:yes gene_type:complete